MKNKIEDRAKNLTSHARVSGTPTTQWSKLMYAIIIPYVESKRAHLTIYKPLKKCIALLGTSIVFYHSSLYAADGDMILKDVFTKLEKTLTGGGFRLATLAGGIGGIVVAGYKGNWPVAGLCLGLAVTAHAFVDWVKESYTYLI